MKALSEAMADQKTKEVWPPGWKVPQRVVQAAAQKGAVIRPLGNVMILMPPPAIPEQLLAELVEITKEAIAEVTADPDPGAHP